MSSSPLHRTEKNSSPRELFFLLRLFWFLFDLGHELLDILDIDRVVYIVILLQ